MKRPARIDARIEAGLKEIADWHQWFVAGHTARLADLHLPQAEYDALLATMTAQAAAMVEKMREQYLANARRQS
jgi:hypothetical protein